MPAVNMAGLTTVPANPSVGNAVLMNPFSGPKGSPFDAKTANGYTSNGVPIRVADPTNYSTGACVTGIGFGPGNVTGPTAPQSIKDGGFNDDYTPGINFFIPSSSTMQTATTSVLVAIGGGKSTATVNGECPTVPYNAQPLLNFGAGGSRDAGAGPAFTGFFEKMVTATAPVANGGVIETGFVNRVSDGTGGVYPAITIQTGNSAFGSSTAASAAIA